MAGSVSTSAHYNTCRNGRECGMTPRVGASTGRRRKWGSHHELDITVWVIESGPRLYWEAAKRRRAATTQLIWARVQGVRIDLGKRRASSAAFARWCVRRRRPRMPEAAPDRPLGAQGAWPLEVCV